MTIKLAGTLVPVTLALAIGCFAVSVDLHNSEVQAAALVLVAGGFVLGAIWPTGAWRWAIIVGSSIVIGDYAAPRLGLIARNPEPVNWGAVIALIPGFVGTYAGVGVRSILGSAGRGL